jgi:hypothetical protein
MIITSHMQNIIQIHPYSSYRVNKKVGRMDRQTNGRYYYIPHRCRGG